MGFIENFKNFDKKQAFIVLLIFLLAFGVRADLVKYQLFFEFDSYYHARMTSYVIENGFAPAKDPLSYYQLGGAMLPAIGPFFWSVNAAIYKIFTMGAPYGKDLWIWFVKILPALYGAITAVLMFFLGKEIYSRKTGYVMGAMTAVVPAFVYRTMAGFYEPTSWGFMWFALASVFFVKAIKELEFNKKTIFYSVLAGITYGIMSIAYSAYLLVPIILGLFLVVAGMLVFGSKQFSKFLNFLKIFAITFVIFGIIASITSNFTWASAVLNWLVNIAPANILIFFVGGCAIVFGFVFYFMLSAKKSEEESAETSKTIRLIAVIALYAALVVMLGFFLMIPAIFNGGFFGRSVGEENTGHQFFGGKYNALVLLPIIALLIIPLRLWRNKDDHLSVFLFFWIFVTLFMAWYKLKFTFQFGIPVAIGFGVVVEELFYFFETKIKNEKYFFAGLFVLGTFLGIAINDVKTAFSEALLAAGIFVFYFVLDKKESWQKLLVAGFIGLMLLTGIAAGTFFVKTNVPNIESEAGWKDALNWISTSTPKDAKFFNWWNQGHWLAFMGERKTFIDNRNLDFNGSANFSKFMISQDITESMQIIDEYKPNYVILSYDMFSSETSFAVYAYETDNPNDQRLQGYFGFASLCNPNGADFSCRGNNITADQMKNLYSSWNNIPNQLEQGRTPIFVYKNRDDSAIFVLNDKVNNSMLAKLWFNNPEAMKYFEEAYSNPALKIFKVK